MVSFPCTAIARATFVVVIALCAVEVQATKIEFSVPASEIEVPDQQKEIKKDANTPTKADGGYRGSSEFVAPAPLYIAARPQEKDPFAPKEKDKKQDTRTLPDPRRTNPTADDLKAAQAAFGRDDETLSSSSWQKDRRDNWSRGSERESETALNRRERTIGWSSLFSDVNEEQRARKDQLSRLNDFRALYETQNSIAPIGTPGANSNPLKDSLWHEPGFNPRTGRTELMSRRDDPQYAQPLPGTRGAAQSYDAGGGRADFHHNEVAPVREFEQHRGVLEFPKRPGDLLR